MKKSIIASLLCMMLLSLCACTNDGSVLSVGTGQTLQQCAGHGDVVIRKSLNEDYCNYTYKDVDFEFISDTVVKITGRFKTYEDITNDGKYDTIEHDEVEHTIYVPLSNVVLISLDDYDKTYRLGTYVG